jgi:hypothetical protein
MDKLASSGIAPTATQVIAAIAERDQSATHQSMLDVAYLPFGYAECFCELYNWRDYDWFTASDPVGVESVFDVDFKELQLARGQAKPLRGKTKRTHDGPPCHARRQTRET